jgi:integrase
VDLDRRIVTIRNSYDGQTKSGSHREVPIPAPLVATLRRHRLEEPWGGEIVFPNDRGELYTKNGKLEDLLRAALGRVGLARIRLHDCRHVYACHFLMAGGSVYDLQKNLGHHSVAFTADVYGHLSADHRVREADRLRFDAPEPAKVLPFAGALG